MKPTKFEDETDLTLINNDFSKDEIIVVTNDKHKGDKQEEEFISYLLLNYETINNLTYCIDLFELVAITLLIIFFCSLFLRCLVVFSPFICLSIIVVSLVFFVLQINFVLKIKTIIDDFENERSNSSSSGSTLLHIEKQIGSGYINSHNSFSQGDKPGLSFSTIFTFVALNLTAINIMCFLVLLTIRINDSLAIKVSYVNIPLLISTIMALCFLIYMLPGLLEKKLFKEIILFFSAGLSLVAFVILLNCKEKFDNQWLIVGSPIICILFLVLIYILQKFYAYSQIINYYLHSAGLTIFLTSLILFLLTLDKHIEIHYALIAFGFLLGIVLITICKLTCLICPKETIFTVKSK